MRAPDVWSRRKFLIGSAAAVLAAGSTADGHGSKPISTSSDELRHLSAGDAVRLMTHGELKAEQYASALLAQCASTSSLNAFIALEPERVLEHAREADLRRARAAPLGLLHGLPVPVKDSINTRDYATTGGTPALRSFRPAQDAPVVASLVQAGAIVLGKTNLHELSYGWTSNNLAFGAVRNPFDPSRIPGGSSGGTAAAVAAHMAPLGVAEDTEGSIRVPAALCGIAGLRPTTGRYPTAGAIPISALFDQVGPHARCVSDLALFDQVAAADPRPIAPASLRGVRLAIGRRFWFAGLDPEVERLADEALRRLADAGVELVEAEVPDLRTLIELTTDQVQNHDVRVQLPKFLRDYAAGVTFEEVVASASRDIRETFARDVLPGGAGFVSEETYRAAVDIHLPRLRRTFREYFARTGATAIVFPATMTTAPRIGEETEVEIAGRRVPFDIAVARNIAAGSTAGLPGLVLPVGLARNGLPVAMEFDGPAGSDRALLSLGMALERVLGAGASPPGAAA